MLDPASDAPTRQLTDEGGALSTVGEGPKRVGPGGAYQPTRIGRYVVLRTLGRGGMGVVFAVYDEELDRRVALKLLHGGLDDDDEARARMKREAHALARLSHPNVVQIYEIGEHEGSMYVAMEHVEGRTLREWGRENPGAWTQYVELMIQAARGLAAAHAAGLVHRDFKPDNVIVGDDGRVRVLDFGLARSAFTEEERSVDATVESSVSSSLNESVTEAGTLLGTPAYMSPEQLLGGSIDGRSDQYSFSVALYEGLYGRRPYSAKGYRALVETVVKGKVYPRPKGTEVPQRLDAIVRRGLAVEPEQRFPDMNALIEALEPPTRTFAGRQITAATLALLLAGGAGGALLAKGGDVCAGADAAFAEVWNGTRASAIEAAIGEVGLPYGDEVWARTSARLDAHAESWVEAHRDACQTHQRGEQSAELLDLRMACLDRSRVEVAALLEVFEKVDKTTLENMVQAASELRPLDRCADLEGLRRVIQAPDPAIAESVTEVRADIERARALWHAGQFKEGHALASDLVTRAGELGYPPLEAEALVIRGELEVELKPSRTAAINSFTAAIAAAEASGYDRARAEATVGLIASHSFVVGHTEYVEAWTPIALALLERVGETGKRAHGRLLALVGEALTHADGREDESAEYLQRAVEIYERELGPEHVALGEPLNTLGMIRSRQRRYDESNAYYRRSISVITGAHGPNHPHLGYLHNNFAMALEGQDQLETAREHYLRALEIFEPAFGSDQLLVSYPLSNLAEVERLMGNTARARELATRALAIREKKGSLRAQAKLFVLLGQLALAEGSLDEAKRQLDRGVEAIEQSRGERDDRLVRPLRARARLAVKAGRPADAEPDLRRALELATDEQRAAVAVELADVLWSAERQDDARSVVTEAQSGASDSATLRAWIDAHGGAQPPTP